MTGNSLNHNFWVMQLLDEGDHQVMMKKIIWHCFVRRVTLILIIVAFKSYPFLETGYCNAVSHLSLITNASTVVLKLIRNVRYLHCPVIEMPKTCANRLFGLVQS